MRKIVVSAVAHIYHLYEFGHSHVIAGGVDEFVLFVAPKTHGVGEVPSRVDKDKSIVNRQTSEFHWDVFPPEVEQRHPARHSDVRAVIQAHVVGREQEKDL